MPARPARPLSTWGLMRVVPKNSIAACDEELFARPIVSRRYIWGRFVSVADPEGVKRVLQDNVDNYPRIRSNRHMFRFGTGTGMLSAEGETWRRHRRVLNPTLDHRSASAEVPSIAALAEELVRRLGEVPPGEPINVGETFTHLVTSATGRLFAAAERDFDEPIYRLGQYPGRYRITDLLGITDPPTRADVLALHPLVDRLVAARRAGDDQDAPDLLRRIVQGRDPLTGSALDQDELRDEILTLGATSATPLRVFPWFWYLLDLHRDCEARLHDELATVLGGRAPSADDLPRLTYLRRLVDETLRLYPPAPTMLRRANADDVVCGTPVPRGTTVGVLPWVIHRHKMLWHDPDRFDPDRFSPGPVAARSRYAYLPFALGPHVCIGAALALIEITVAVAVVAQTFRFRLAPGHPVEPIAWTNLHPKGGMWMTVERR